MISPRFFKSLNKNIIRRQNPFDHWDWLYRWTAPFHRSGNKNWTDSGAGDRNFPRHLLRIRLQWCCYYILLTPAAIQKVLCHRRSLQYGFHDAVSDINEVLQIRGKVLPVTDEPITLKAILDHIAHIKFHCLAFQNRFHNAIHQQIGNKWGAADSREGFARNRWTYYIESYFGWWYGDCWWELYIFFTTPAFFSHFVFLILDDSLPLQQLIIPMLQYRSAYGCAVYSQSFLYSRIAPLDRAGSCCAGSSLADLTDDFAAFL